jgi:hypothetical protein
MIREINILSSEINILSSENTILSRDISNHFDILT